MVSKVPNSEGVKSRNKFFIAFLRVRNFHLVGLNGVEICQLFVVSESVKTAKDFMFDTLPYKVFDVNCEIAKTECFLVILLLIKYY